VARQLAEVGDVQDWYTQFSLAFLISALLALFKSTSKQGSSVACHAFLILNRLVICLGIVASIIRP